MYVATLLTNPDSPSLEQALTESLRNAWGGGEAVFRTASVAGEPHLTVAAVLGQRVALAAPELQLAFGVDEVPERRVGDVAEVVVGFDEVVAGVDVAVVLQRHGGTAGLGEDAHC